MTGFSFRPLLLAAAAGVVPLAACAPVPQLGARPEVRAADAYDADRSLAPASAATAWPAADWWSAYGDPQLDALIAEGLADSPDVASAAARLRSAEAYAEQVGAARLPSVAIDGNATETKQSYNNGIPADFVPHGWNDTGTINANLGFDLDLWGRNRAALAAATSEAQASRIDVAQARLVLSTNIAAAYADLARFAAERAVQVRELAVRSQTQRLVADRVTNGLDTRAELKQADATLPAVRAQIAATDEAIGLTRNRLAALLGKGPDRGLAIVLPALPDATGGLPVGVTTDLIGRRPDIAASRARVEASASRIKVARADFYPALSLSALVGFQSLGLDNLFKSGSTYGHVGPAFSLPIFRGGQLSGQYKGARAEYDQAVASYDGSVANAYREVADAVTSQRALVNRLSESRQALDASEQAYSLARQRYEGGLSTFLDVLTAEDRVLQNRSTVADLEARAFALDVQLIRALGGGFSTNTAAQAARKDTTHG
ncbi:efflux transporter outer membrane subunit [Sphingomonas sp. ac-8]|uniref:efflux transporter outer membrane subunit n=1 Tax=Sphingomonas sp. ac-8 TaxID=3242977 RepID=UPI003A8065F0